MTGYEKTTERLILESARKTPVIARTDVLVAGGGTAGVVAALAAASKGVHVLLVEQFGSLGGSSTNALVTPQMGTGMKGENPTSSFSRLIDERLEALTASGPGIPSIVYDPETLKFVLEQLVEEAGVQTMYYTFVCDPILDGHALKGLIVENKNGRGAILAQCVIDCTGDGDVCARCGVEFESGSPADGKNQAMSLRYMMAGIDFKRLSAFLNRIEPGQRHDPDWCHTAFEWKHKERWPIGALFEKAIAAGDLEYSDGLYWQMFSVPGKPTFAAFNCPGIYDRCNGVCTEDLTNAQREGRKTIFRHIRFYQKYLPGFEKASLALVAPMVGVRESRRIRGDYTLTAQDVFSYRKFADGVARCNYPMDVHDALLEDVSLHYDETVPKGEQFYEIPFQCLLPRGIDHLVVAGRCISCDFLAESSMRIIPIVRALGDAAGTAAAFAAQQRKAIREIPGIMIREDMKARGAAL